MRTRTRAVMILVAVIMLFVSVMAGSPGEAMAATPSTGGLDITQNGIAGDFRGVGDDGTKNFTASHFLWANLDDTCVGEVYCMDGVLANPLDPGMNAPLTTRTSLSEYSHFDAATKQRILAVLYYGWGGPGFNSSIFDGIETFGMSWDSSGTTGANTYYAMTHIALSMLTGEGTYDFGPALEVAGYKIIARAENLASLSGVNIVDKLGGEYGMPIVFESYHSVTAGHGGVNGSSWYTQRLIGWANLKETGQLTVTKVARGVNGSSDGIPTGARWQFNVKVYNEAGGVWKDETFTLGNGESRTIPSIPRGYTYRVSEDASQLYDTSIANATGTIAGGTTSTATATNTRRTGELKVRKVATGPGIPAGKTWPFKVTIRNDSGTVWRTETFDLGNGGEKTISSIPTGYTYTVEETLGAADAARYAVTGVPVSGTIGEGTVTVTGSNARRTGNFEVSKVVDRSRIDDTGLDANRTFDIVVQLKDESGNAVTGTYGDMAFTNGSCRLTLKDGDVRRATGVPTEYSWVVSEPSVPGGYELLGITNATGSITADKTVRSVVTNSQQPGWARVTKITR